MTDVMKRYAGPALGIWLCAEIIASIFLLFHLDPSAGAFVGNILLPFEVMIVLPALVYFFVMRKYKLTPLLVLPISYLGGLIVNVALHPADLTCVLIFATVMLFIEIGIGIYEVSRLVRRFKEVYASSDDPFTWFSETIFAFLPNRRVAKLVSMELSILYYAFFTWKKTVVEVPGVKCFSYHEKSGYSALVSVLIGVSVIEIVVMHMLLAQWSFEAALVVTLLSVYFVFWLLGDLRATILRPVKIEGEYMIINSGIRISARIPLSTVESIGSKDPELGKEGTLNLGMMGNSDCWILLKESVEIEGFFGGKHLRKAIGLTLDDTAGFRRAIVDARK